MAVSSKSFFNFPTSASGGRLQKGESSRSVLVVLGKGRKLVHANIAVNVKISVFSHISSSKSLHTSQIRLDALYLLLRTLTHGSVTTNFSIKSCTDTGGFGIPVRHNTNLVVIDI